MLYDILMKVVYCQNSLRGVMMQVWVLMCLYCYFFQLEGGKKAQIIWWVCSSVAEKGLEGVLSTAEMSDLAQWV